jgi:hypothetical protein
MAVAASLLVAASPVFHHASLWPMSDVPVAALWTLALWLALRPGLGSAAGAGLLAGMATLTRPNLLLVLAAFVIGAAVIERGRGILWPIPRRALIIGLVASPFVIAAAVIQARLYGSPLRSGYGPMDYLYQLSNIGPNVMAYGADLLSAQTPLVLLAAVPLVSMAFGRRRTAMLALVTAAWIASYLPYAQFEEWWYLRFFLGLFPLLCIAWMAGLARLLRPARAMRLPVLWVVTLAVMVWGIGFATRRGVLDLRDVESRYVTIARYVADALPPNAAIVSMQHSGSIRYYAGRLTVRYDTIDPGGLARVLQALVARGYRPYVVIDGWEFEALAARLGEGAKRAHLLARTQSDARVYDLLAEGPPARAPLLLTGAAGRCPHPATGRNW